MEFKRVWQEKEGLYYYEGTDGKRYGEGYKTAGEFHGDLALVKDKHYNKYFIDRNFKKYGEYYEDIVDFSEGVAVVKSYDGKWRFIKQELNEYGYLDEYGQGSVGLKQHGEGWDEQPRSFSEGFAIVKEDGGYRFVDTYFIYHGWYDEADGFSDGIALVKRGGKCYYIDKEFYPHGERYDYAYPFSDGIALVKKDGKWYFVDNKKFELHGEGYDLVDSSFSEGYAAVKKDGKWYFVDNKDFKLHGEGYDYAYDFKGGIARVKKDGKWYYVDNKDFKLHGEGYDYVYKFENGVAEVEKGGRRYIINTSFERIKRRGKELEEADYLEGVEHDGSIMGIPTALFTDEFVEKLKQAVYKHFSGKIDQCNDINEVEKLKNEMKKAREDLDQKRAMYRKKEMGPQAFMRESLKHQLDGLF